MIHSGNNLSTNASFLWLLEYRDIAYHAIAHSAKCTGHTTRNITQASVI